MNNMLSITGRNFYKSTSDKTVGIYSETSQDMSFKTGEFFLNDKAIKITKGDDLETVTNKINKLSIHTGIKAEIVKSPKGAKLHLISKNQVVDIKDQDGVLAKIYNMEQIEILRKHLIHITSRDETKPLEILYNKFAANNGLAPILADLAKASLKTPALIMNSLIALNEVEVVEEILPQPGQLFHLHDTMVKIDLPQKHLRQRSNINLVKNTPEEDDEYYDMSSWLYGKVNTIWKKVAPIIKNADNTSQYIVDTTSISCDFSL